MTCHKKLQRHQQKSNLIVLNFILFLFRLQKIRIFAGVTYDRDGNPVSSAQGRLCEWVEDPSQPADKFTSFGAYQRTLKLHCEEGEPAIMQFKPDVNTPDTIYYQVCLIVLYH